MTNSAIVLSNLISDTLDGDWGKGDETAGATACRVIRGADFPRVRLGSLSNVPIRYLSKSSLERRTLRPNDIIIETAGGAPGRPTGRTALVTDRLYKMSDLPLTCASFCRFLRINPSAAEPAYVYWYLQYLHAKGEMWMHQVQHTGVARFQYTRFANSVEIPLPPAPVQRAIAHFLTALDEKTALNDQLNKTLETIGKTIFKHWFIDFEFPDEEGKPYNSSGGAISESDLGEIPEGWEAKEFGSLFGLTMGLSPRGESYNSEGKGIPLLNGAADFEGDHIFPTKYTTQPTRMNKVDDLIFCIRGTIGNIAIADKQYCLGRGVAALTPKTGYLQEFIYFKLHEILNVLIQNASGSVIIGLSKGDISEHKVVIPPLWTLRQFHALTNDLFLEKRLNGRETRSLISTRESLLPKLFSGKVRVPVEVR
jgi:type I restriction enzyme, S subunit